MPSSPAKRGSKMIVMPKPLEGGRLGLAVKDLEVLGVIDPAAYAFGWAVGDKILSVNGVPLKTQEEFDDALAAAMQDSRVFLTPLTFETSRRSSNNCCC